MTYFNWIRAEDYSMDTFLLFDRWVIRYIMSENNCQWYNNGTRDYKTDMAKALSRYPYVITFCKRKAPECTEFLDEIAGAGGTDEEDARDAETAILSALETFVVYAWPEVMDQLSYIRNWQPQRLYDLVDLSGKIVLDVGAGTGRLSFAAAERAVRVYASEPCDVLREYMRDKIREKNITNIKVLDGDVRDLPYEDDTFDVVMSGHVVGDFYDGEIAEMTRVTKSGGVIVCCNGEDERRRTAPDSELVSRGFEYFMYEGRSGGIMYDYRKMV